MFALDIKQSGKRIGLRLLFVIGIVLILLLMGDFGAFEKIKPMLEKIPDYFRDILGFDEYTDMTNGRNWLLSFSIFIEIYFIYIACMDAWDYVTMNKEKQRFLFIGNQLYSQIEYVLYGYLFLTAQFMFVWIPYKLFLVWIGRGLFAGIPTIINGIGIYLVIIALAYLVSVAGLSRDVSPEFLFVIAVLTFGVGNLYKVFALLNERIVEQGNFANEQLIELTERTKGLFIYSLPSYLNPFRVAGVGVAFKTFGMGLVISMLLAMITIYIHQKQEY